jgi:serine/threonine-protein kinase
MPLPPGFAALLDRHGPPLRFAARAVLHGLVPDRPALADLVGRALAEEQLPAAERDLAEQALDLLATELPTLLVQVAALESLPEAAAQVVKVTRETDSRCQEAAGRLAALADAAEARQGRGELAATLDAPPPAARVALEVIAGPHRGARFTFDRHETFLVGRAPAANLQLLDDPYFSRHHFLLEVNPPSCYLRDLGSCNGTLVNGRQVRDCHLQDGDVISGGRTQIRFAVHSGPEPEAVAAPAPLDRAAPQQVPGYEILKELGRGGMGVVYLARRHGTSTNCALKVVVPELAAREQVMQRFLREVNVLSRLDHPRIVRFQEMGTFGGQFYFAMDYVETVNLRGVLAAYPEPTRVAALCGLVCHVLEGLAYAHARGFVHRDVKPANVLVSGPAPKLRARLADFGLAKNFENAGFSAMTREGQVVGTLAFMPPEQVVNARGAQPAVDLYAAGATLYYLLGHRYPYDFGRGKDQLAVILEDPPVPLTRHCPALPAGLAEVVERCLAKDPRDRFATAEDLRQALLPYARPASAGRPDPAKGSDAP